MLRSPAAGAAASAPPPDVSETRQLFQRLDVSAIVHFLPKFSSADTVNSLQVERMTYGLEQRWQQQQEGARLVNPLQRNHTLYFSPLLLSS